MSLFWVDAVTAATPGVGNSGHRQSISADLTELQSVCEKLQTSLVNHNTWVCIDFFDASFVSQIFQYLCAFMSVLNCVFRAKKKKKRTLYANYCVVFYFVVCEKYVLFF